MSDSEANCPFKLPPVAGKEAESQRLSAWEENKSGQGARPAAPQPRPGDSAVRGAALCVFCPGGLGRF